MPPGKGRRIGAANLRSVSPIDALRTRRSLDDLPPVSSDDELVAWARGLTVHSPGGAPRRNEPLRAARTSEPAPRARRREPLRANRAVAEPAPSAEPAQPHATTLSTEEIFTEIADRAAGVRRPRLRLRVAVTPR